jgi:hypothetical protein
MVVAGAPAEAVTGCRPRVDVLGTEDDVVSTETDDDIGGVLAADKNVVARRADDRGRFGEALMSLRVGRRGGRHQGRHREAHHE